MGTGVGPRDASLRRALGALTLKAMIEAERQSTTNDQFRSKDKIQNSGSKSLTSYSTSHINVPLLYVTDC